MQNWSDMTLDREMEGLRENLRMAIANGLLPQAEGYANRLDTMVFEKRRRQQHTSKDLAHKEDAL